MTSLIPFPRTKAEPLACACCGAISNQAWIKSILLGDGQTPPTVDDILDAFCDEPRTWLEVDDLYLLAEALPSEKFAQVLSFVLFADLTEYAYISEMVADLWQLDDPSSGAISDAGWAAILNAAGYTVDGEDAARPTEPITLIQMKADRGWAWTVPAAESAAPDSRRPHRMIFAEPERLMSCSTDGGRVRYLLDMRGLAVSASEDHPTLA